MMRRSSKAIGVAAAGLLAAAIITELRKPSDERTWEGSVAGIVPYDLRPPTVERLRQRVWAPDDERLLMPHFFGVGWTVNIGRLARRAGLA
jgi:hypothetical protein